MKKILFSVIGALSLASVAHAQFSPGPGQPGTGTVTSAGMSLPSSVFNITGSPVITTGTMTGTFKSQSANTIFAAPDGASGVPVFRTITGADLPVPTALLLGGVKSAISPTNNFMTGIDTTGSPSFAQPDFTNLSGSISLPQLGASANGASWLNPYIPNLSTSVQSTGTPGMDGGAHWFLYNAPTTVDQVNTLRLDRKPSYTGGTAGTNNGALWARCEIGANVVNSEWCIKVTTDNKATSGNNLALNATATRYSTSNSTWGANIVCQQNDGIADPTKTCTTLELDQFGDGTDANKQRVGLQISANHVSTSSMHAYTGIMIGAHAGDVYDNILVTTNLGTYGNGINMGGSTFSGCALCLPASGAIAFDTNGGAGYNRSLYYSTGAINFATPNGVVGQWFDGGRLILGNNTVTSGAQLVLSTTAGSCTHTPGASTETVSCSSDERLKHDIIDTRHATDKLKTMRVRDFTFNATGERRTGVIAQEMLKTNPDMVHVDDKGMYRVDEPNIWLLVSSIQEIDAKNHSLQYQLYGVYIAMIVFAFVLYRKRK